MTGNTSHTEPSGIALSQRWQDKFALLERIGADQSGAYALINSPAYKALGYREKQRISFNLLAFVFGPLYYFVKQMHYKGAALLTASWLFAAMLTLAEIIIGTVLPSVLYWVPTAVVCAQLANHDYYRHVRQAEQIWPGMPELLRKPIGAILLPIGALLVLLALSIFSPPTDDQARAYMLEDVSGVWRGDSDGAMVRIELEGREPQLTVNGQRIPVTVDRIDLDNHVVTLGVTLNNGQAVQWSLRKIIDRDESFTLRMTLHQGTQDELSFVSQL